MPLAPSVTTYLSAAGFQMRFTPGQEVLPALLGSRPQIEGVFHQQAFRPNRLLFELHLSLNWRAPALVAVAGNTAGNDVIPGHAAPL